MLLLPLKNYLIVQILLFGSENYDSTANKIIISFVMEFIIKSKRFEDAFPRGKTYSVKTYCQGSTFYPTGVLFYWVISTGGVLIS